MASLPQQFYALSGRASLADLPYLYGRAGMPGRGVGAPGQPGDMNAMQGDPQALQFPAFVASGGSGGGAPAGGGSPGGGGGPGAAAALAGGGGANQLSSTIRNLALGRPLDDFGRGEGGGFTGASNMTSDSDRYADMARRGTADLTLDNIIKALGFNLGLGPTTPMTIMAGELAEEMGLPNQMGLPEYTGYQPIRGRPRNMVEYLAALRGSRDAADMDIGNQLRGSTPGARLQGALRSGWIDPRTAGMMGGGGGGGFGGSYGAGDVTSKGPGGTLGHI